MACTKETLRERLMEGMGLEKKAADEALGTLLEILKDTLGSGEDIMISGFGKFSVNEKAARKGRNPATNSAMMLPPRRVVTFRCAGRLKDRMNRR